MMLNQAAGRSLSARSKRVRSAIGSLLMGRSDGSRAYRSARGHQGRRARAKKRRAQPSGGRTSIQTSDHARGEDRHRGPRRTDERLSGAQVELAPVARADDRVLLPAELALRERAALVGALVAESEQLVLDVRESNPARREVVRTHLAVGDLASEASAHEAVLHLRPLPTRARRPS